MCIQVKEIPSIIITSQMVYTLTDTTKCCQKTESLDTPINDV